MHLLIFPASWICFIIAFSVAVDNLDVSLYDNPSADPNLLDLGVNDLNLFEDSSASDLSLFTDNLNNQWDLLPNSDTTLSLVDNNNGDSNLPVAPQNGLDWSTNDLLSSPSFDEGLFVCFAFFKVNYTALLKSI